MKSIAPVCGVNEITRAILKHHYRFDYNSLAKIDLTSISTAFQSYLNDERLCAINLITMKKRKKKSPPSGESNPGPLDQKVNSLPIGLPGLLLSKDNMCQGKSQTSLHVCAVWSNFRSGAHHNGIGKQATSEGTDHTERTRRPIHVITVRK